MEKDKRSHFLPDRLVAAFDEEAKKQGSYIAMVIRNAMEDFHCQHLSEDQMKQLNPYLPAPFSPAYGSRPATHSRAVTT